MAATTLAWQPGSTWSTGCCDRDGVELDLRRASATDAAAVADVYVDSWNVGFGSLMPPRSPGPDLVDRWTRDLTSGMTRWWLAESRGVLLGFVGTGPSRDPVDPTLGELDTIAVSPSAWRHGVGRALMNAAFDDLRAAGFASAILWTVAGYPRGNTFYAATGWTPSGLTRDDGRQVAYRRQWTEAREARR